MLKKGMKVLCIPQKKLPPNQAKPYTTLPDEDCIWVGVITQSERMRGPGQVQTTIRCVEGRYKNRSYDWWLGTCQVVPLTNRNIIAGMIRKQLTKQQAVSIMAEGK